MTTTEAVHIEEQQVRRRYLALDKAQRTRSRAHEKAMKAQIANAIRSKRTKDCRCGLYVGMGPEQIRALGAGCTSPRWICPTLDGVRRVVGL